jgi:MarR family transcriptional regulator, organic hydroperoxide resistance regulator
MNTSKTASARKPAPAVAVPSPVYVPPLSVSHRALLLQGKDEAFRDLIYSMVLSFGRLLSCREAFGREIGLTGSQYTVLIGVAHRQGSQGVSIRALAEHVLLASTHVTTEVGRLIRKGLLQKRPNRDDRRSVLVSLSPRGQRVLEGLAPFLRQINDTLFQDIGPAEFDSLGQILQRFTRNTEAAMQQIGPRQSSVRGSNKSPKAVKKLVRTKRSKAGTSATLRRER